MRDGILPALLRAFVLPGVVFLLQCAPDAQVEIHVCLAGGDLAQVEVWYDSAVLVPRESIDLLPLSLRQGIRPTMSRTEIEELLAPYLQTRKTNRSEFLTPLGRLNWSLDREISGGYEARVTRVYIYPDELLVSDFLDPKSVDCLRKAAPKATALVIRRGDGQGQLATVRVDGLTVKTIILQQTPSP